VATAVTVAHPGSVVADDHLDHAVAVLDDDLGLRRTRMLDRVRQTFLNEPIGGEVDSGGKLVRLAFDAQVDRETSLARLLDEPTDMLQARLRCECRRLLRSPQHPDHAAHLGKRLASRSLDDQKRVALTLLVRSKQPPHAGSLHRHDADAVPNDVVELARDTCPLLGNGRPRDLVDLLELPSEDGADDPRDREDDADEDELADLASGIVVDDDRLDADSERQPQSSLRAIAKLRNEENRRNPGQSSRKVVLRERVVDERGENGEEADGDRSAEGEPAPSEQHSRDGRREDDVRPERAVRTVLLSLTEDHSRDRDANRDQDQGVEPVAPRERLEPLHALKVLRSPALRLGRENEPQIVRKDELESPSRPRRTPSGRPYGAGMSTNGFVVETFGLTKRFGDRTAVSNVELRVPRGSAFGYLGPNGAGKTTLIRMLLGLTQATAGTMRLLGHPVPERRAAALARVGAIVEEPRFHGHLTGRENLSVIAAARGLEAHDRIDHALERVGLSQRADERVKRYSLGMRQRLGVARSLLADPELLILDEPTNGLDPAGIREFRDMIRGFVAEGRTVLLSSHLLDEVEKICDEVAIVDRGTVVAQGPIAELAAGAKQTILVATSDDERALAIFSEHSGIESVAVEPIGIRVTLGADAGDDISLRLVHAGLAIRRFEPARVSLEQRFLEITSRLEDAA
jgi:ABC-2 type transport system ATP-binding protein